MFCFGLHAVLGIVRDINGRRDDDDGEGEEGEGGGMHDLFSLPQPPP